MPRQLTAAAVEAARPLVQSPGPLLLVLAGLLSNQSGLPQVAFLVAVAALLGGAWRLVRSVGRLHVADDALLAAVTVATAWLAIVAEVLSLGEWLGSMTGWLVGCLVLYWGSFLVPSPTHTLDWRTPLAPIRTLRWPGQLLFMVWLLPVMTLGILVWFTGITNADSLLTYFPRAVQYLDRGTFSVYTGQLDYLQYLHTTLVAFPMLFLRTDVHVNALSMLSALLASVGLAAFCRSLGWGGTLPLIAAALPWTTPKLLLSAPTSGFDIFEAQWLVFVLYFLRRGHPSTSVRWLVLAAVAAALGLASKPTFYFAAPGLALLFALCISRGVRRGRLRRTVAVIGVALLSGVLIGAPSLIRNVVTQGYLIAPPGDSDMLAGQGGYGALTPADRLRSLAVNGFGLSLALLTPPYFLPESVNGRVNGWLQRAARAIDSERSVAQWPELLRHGSERYHAGLAGFGGAVPLVLLPAALLVPFAARRLGPRGIFLFWVVWLSASYFFVLAAVIPISPHSNRYLIEWLLLLSTIAPAVLTALPVRRRGVVACALAVPLLLEMHDTLQHSRHVPVATVLRLSREEQTYTLFGWPTRELLDAVRTFDRRYPPNVVPTVYVVRRFEAEYLFSGPSLARRMQGWTVPRAPAEPITLPGLVLTQNGDIAKTLGAQPNVVVERLAAGIWLLHPLDTMVVLTEPVGAVAAGEPSFALQAFAQRQQFQQPAYRFVLLRADGAEEVLRDFAPESRFVVPDSVARRGSVRIDLRDAAGSATARTTLALRR